MLIYLDSNNSRLAVRVSGGQAPPLLVSMLSKQKEPATPDRTALGARQIGGRGDSAEKDEEIPERTQHVFLFGAHGEEPRWSNPVTIPVVIQCKLASV